MHKLLIYLALAAIVVASYFISLRSISCPICLGIGIVRARWSRHGEHPCGRCGGTGQVS